jgi:hypothetical protein
MQGKAGQGKAGQVKALKDKTRQGKAIKRQDKTGQDRTGHDKTRQDTTRPRQDKTSTHEAKFRGGGRVRSKVEIQLKLWVAKRREHKVGFGSNLSKSTSPNHSLHLEVVQGHHVWIESVAFASATAHFRR